MLLDFAKFLERSLYLLANMVRKQREAGSELIVVAAIKGLEFQRLS